MNGTSELMLECFRLASSQNASNRRGSAKNSNKSSIGVGPTQIRHSKLLKRMIVLHRVRVDPHAQGPSFLTA